MDTINDAHDVCIVDNTRSVVSQLVDTLVEETNIFRFISKPTLHLITYRELLFQLMDIFVFIYMMVAVLPFMFLTITWK
jgi:hypothetical protein